MSRIFVIGSCLKRCRSYLSTHNTFNVLLSKKQTSGDGNNTLNELDLSFNDHKTAFKSKTTWEIFRALIVYDLCSVPALVENNMKIMRTFKKAMGNYLFTKLMKLSFYSHFVAGENEVKIVPVLNRLASFGVRPILDYSAEEDLSQQEAEMLEKAALNPSVKVIDTLDPSFGQQFRIDPNFLDRRYKGESARTYFYINELSCERNMEIFIRCLEAVAPYGEGFAAIKLTALGRPQLLLHVSEVITKTRASIDELFGGPGAAQCKRITRNDLVDRLQTFGFSENDILDFQSHLTEDRSGIIHMFPWTGIIDADSKLSSTFTVPDLNTKQMVRLIYQLTEQEEAMFRNMIRRARTVIQAALQLNVNVMVDAEQTYFQPAISRITMELMRKYNQHRPIVCNTYQCYLKDTLNEIKTDLDQAKRQGFYFGAKLVRGAYLEQERARAQSLQYPDPTNPYYAATTNMYHAALRECMQRIKAEKDAGNDPKRITVMVATHNEDTVQTAIKEMKLLRITPDDRSISFGQLYGMCDYITFPLGQSGYAAYKYIPYGPVAEVLPYLSRRVQENKGILEKVKKEKKLLRRELLRRILSLNFFRRPKGHIDINNSFKILK